MVLGGFLVGGRERSERNTDQVVEPGLHWHPTLYAGSAPYYTVGRVSYPMAIRGRGLPGRRLQRPTAHRVPGQVVERISDQIVAGIFSLSSSTPHLFGERREAFEADLRRLLRDANPSGVFSEQLRGIAVDIWRAGSGWH